MINHLLKPKIITIIIILVTLVISVYLVKKNQENRSKAWSSGGTTDTGAATTKCDSSKFWGCTNGGTAVNKNNRTDPITWNCKKETYTSVQCKRAKYVNGANCGGNNSCKSGKCKNGKCFPLGKTILNTARSLKNKVCYYFGGGHSHFYPQPVKGVDPNWGKKTYVDTDGRTKTFGDNRQFNPGSPSRTIYGLDCSGFVKWVYYQNGISLSGNIRAWYDNYQKVNILQLQPGDLGMTNDMQHVGIYAGNGKWVHSGPEGKLGVCGGQPGYVQEGTYSGFVKFARL